jgi:hypothetical protein
LEKVSRLLFAVGILLAVGAIALGAFLASKKPLYNNDLVGYLGVAMSYSDNDSASVHRKVYSAAKREIPDENYKKLIEKSDYRIDLFNNEKYFTEQLPFYSVKPAYPLLIYTLVNMGVRPVLATIVISNAFYILSFAVVLLWLLKVGKPVLAGIITAVLALSHPFQGLAAYSTPDSMSMAVLISAMYLLTNGDRRNIGFLMLITSIIVRPNNIIYLFLIVFYFAAFAPPREKISVPKGLVILATGFLVYLTLVIVSGNYGWEVLFHHSFVHYILQPSTFVSPLSLTDYLRVYYRQMFVGLNSMAAFYVFIGLIAAILHASRARISSLPIESGISLTTAAFLAINWLAFPSQINRIAVAQYLILAVLMAVGALQIFARNTHSGASTNPLGR